MPRIITVALQNELSLPVTRVGYLVQWNGSFPYRWSNIGAVTYNAVPWIDFDFSLTGLEFDPEKEQSATLTAGNLDDAAAAFFLQEVVSDMTVDIYQFAGGALATGDAPKLARLAVGAVSSGLDTTEVQLVSYATSESFSPRRRIDTYNGFNFALPAGTKLPWENQIFILEEAP